jgi:hypothetical protein
VTQTSDRVPDVPGDSTTAAGAMFPPGRYGRRRDPKARRPRWVVPVIAIAVLAIMGGLTVKLYKQYGNPQYTPTVIKLTNVTDSSIDVTFRVSKPNGAAATCTVDALTRAGAALGSAQVPVPAGTNVQVTATIKTTARAYIAQVPSCHSAD